MTRNNRKAFFLGTTARRGLHGGILKDDQGHEVEVGPGFAAAVAAVSGDDTRDPNRENPNTPPKVEATQELPDDTGGGEGDDAGDEGDDAGDEGDEGEKGKKRNTSEFIRDLKKERRELRRELAESRSLNSSIESRLAAIENRGSTPSGNSDTPSTTKDAAPDPTDAAKYPLGVLDDGYIEDKIKWTAKSIVAETLDQERQGKEAQAEQARADAHMGQLREKVDVLAEAGSELHDDYMEVVLEAGLAGKFPLTETTFTAAAEADHGAEILYRLATDKKEADRVSGLSIVQQVRYVLEKDAEISSTAQPRRKPRADPPPSDTPRGRNPSSPIRVDTDNLDDFRKAWYKN